jgi:hypothetical protein
LWIDFTVPPRSAASSFSIFIASSTITPWPTATTSPTATRSFTTLPAMGARSSSPVAGPLPCATARASLRVRASSTLAIASASADDSAVPLARGSRSTVCERPSRRIDQVPGRTGRASTASSLPSTTTRHRASGACGFDGGSTVTSTSRPPTVTTSSRFKVLTTREV